MIIEVKGWDKDRAWTDWGGHFKKDLGNRIESACPSMRLTERKRLAKRISSGEPVIIKIEDTKYAESLAHILEATGALLSVRNQAPNKAPEPTR
jgi:hypothetical protein